MTRTYTVDGAAEKILAVCIVRLKTAGVGNL